MMLEIVSEVEHKEGRTVRGHYCTLDTGEVIYLARRAHRHIFRGGHGSISAALIEEHASWALDEKLLYTLRAKGIARLGVRTIDTEDLYLATTAVFFDPKIQIRVAVASATSRCATSS
jgi:hypothetical protein